jgi:hypothetical protein
MFPSKSSNYGEPVTPDDSENITAPSEQESSAVLNEQTDVKQPDPDFKLNEHTNVKQPSRRDWTLTCIGLYLGALLYGKVLILFSMFTVLTLDLQGLDTTIAATVQGSVYEDLGNLQKLPWVGIGFPLGSVAVVLLIGKLFQTFEIKWLYTASVLLFEIGSAICGAAPNTNALIVGRVIAGIGGSGMYIGYLIPTPARGPFCVFTNNV